MVAHDLKLNNVPFFALKSVNINDSLSAVESKFRHFLGCCISKGSPY